MVETHKNHYVVRIKNDFIFNHEMHHIIFTLDIFGYVFRFPKHVKF